VSGPGALTGTGPRHRRGGGRILTLGDAAVDVIVEPEEDLRTDDDVPASVALGTGGQAANVAAWCASFGVPAGVIAATGDDLPAQMVRRDLAARAVEVLGPRRSGRGPGVVSLVGAGGERTMISDRGVSASLVAADIEPAWFADAEWLHLSGYALFGPAGPQAALAAADLARSAGAGVSVDLSAATLLRAVGAGRVRQLIAATGARLVFANRAEAEVTGPLEVATTVVKRGADGCSVITAGGVIDEAAAPGAVVRDTTGAGDAFAAGWLVGGLDLALHAARTCIGRPGSMPPA
jgi:sugar/nucleoside kinase (ribokinase family)